MKKHRHIHYEDDSHFDDTFDIRVFLKHRRDFHDSYHGKKGKENFLKIFSKRKKQKKQIPIFGRY